MARLPTCADIARQPAPAATPGVRAPSIDFSPISAGAKAIGSGASDPTVMDIWGDIGAEGRVNAGVAQAMSQQKADGMTYQAALDRWKADAQKKIANVSAAGTLLGGAYGGYSTGYGT